MLLATGAFSEYTKLTGGVNDRNTGLLRLTTSQFSKVENLSFITSAVRLSLSTRSLHLTLSPYQGTFVLTPNAQAWPRSLNTLIGGTSGNVYLIVNSLGTPAGEGLDFINGFTFLERFYAVFDTGNKRIGFATTSFTDATTNWKKTTGGILRA